MQPLRTLVVGAGQAGEMVVRQIAGNPGVGAVYQVTGFVDDDINKTGVAGLPVHHGITDIRAIAAREHAEAVIIAIPSAGKEAINRIIDSVSGLRLRIKIVPGISEIIEGNVYWEQIRDIRPEDLLGREEVSFEVEQLAPYFRGETVLVTGGGGSIGSEICRQLLSLPVARVVALGHGENSIYRLLQELRDEPRLAGIVADVNDRARIGRIMQEEKVGTVFHAAAHKHVPLMEMFPGEAARNNILGTVAVAESALAAGVGRFVLISTDKAVNPSSVMGASKRVCERLVLGMGGEGTTQFLVTRFGNVLGSRGSVVPLFERQIRQGGPVTLTHPEVSRYFMSIREAARLVIKAATLRRGRIFVLDMGRPVLIRELAERLIRLHGYSLEEIPIVATGLRPGEKLEEELLHRHEQLDATRYEKLSISYNVAGAIMPAGRGRLVDVIREKLAAFDEAGLRELLFTTAAGGN